MAIGDLITASDYNSIRTDINQVLGQTTVGYGQTLRSSNVAISSLVTSENMRLLYLDLISARLHQTGSVDSTVAFPLVGNLIAWETSTNPDGVKKGINDFINLKNLTSSFDGQVSGFPDSSFSLASITTSSRNGNTNPWGTSNDTPTITHEFTITFLNASHMSYFFNSGGQIRFTGSLINGTSSKSTDWANMLTSMGVIAFDKWKTVSLSASGTGSNIGSSTLTSTYQVVYTKFGSSVYSDNFYRIEARSPSSLSIQFRITFNDADVGTSPTTPIDENVDGTVTSVAQVRQPNSSFTVNSVNYNAVVVAIPTTTVQSSL